MNKKDPGFKKLKKLLKEHSEFASQYYWSTPGTEKDKKLLEELRRLEQMITAQANYLFLTEDA